MQSIKTGKDRFAQCMDWYEFHVSWDKGIKIVRMYIGSPIIEQYGLFRKSTHQKYGN